MIEQIRCPSDDFSLEEKNGGGGNYDIFATLALLKINKKNQTMLGKG